MMDKEIAKLVWNNRKGVRILFHDNFDSLTDEEKKKAIGQAISGLELTGCVLKAFMHPFLTKIENEQVQTT